MQQLTEEPIERTIADEIQQLYRTQLGKAPDQLTCQLIGNKIMIWIEGGLTQPELMLLNQGHTALVQQLRNCLHQILQPKLKTVIEQTIQSTVVDLLTAVHLETDRISFIAVCEPSRKERVVTQGDHQNLI